MDGIHFSPAEMSVVGALLGALGTVVTVLWRYQLTVNTQLITSLNERLEAVIKDRDAYRDIAEEALAYLDAIRTRTRGRHKDSDFTFIPRPPTLHHSLSTQNDDDASLRAAMAQRVAAAGRDLNYLTDLDYKPLKERHD